MEYLTKDLYIKCFNAESYDAHEDRFLIGHINRNKNKLKDVITDEIVQGSHFLRITGLKSFGNGGIQMAIGYMTGLKAVKSSIRQQMLAKEIDVILSKDVINQNDIIRIKKIMNQELLRTHNKEIKGKNLLQKKQKSLKKYSRDEAERNF